ncbi:hypothetical protein PoB_006701600 [Plakobranchus ocellatus]|uniref:Uncharacterized protein n=1 Tax=Plakobranchus ocellatus TaxID=259542 RepID=A0AAV4D8N5_9GAST|nr:hypothetical protein PoB_006701600 [Plakobranchus ocellatus]
MEVGAARRRRVYARLYSASRASTGGGRQVVWPPALRAAVQQIVTAGQGEEAAGQFNRQYKDDPKSGNFMWGKGKMVVHNLKVLGVGKSESCSLRGSREESREMHRWVCPVCIDIPLQAASLSAISESAFNIIGTL